MQLSLPKDYEYQSIIDKHSDALFIGLAVGGKFQESPIKQVSTLSIKDKGKTFLLYNVGSLCQKIADFILKSHIKKVVLFGSNNASYATIIWAYLLSRFLHKNDIRVGFVAINPTINPVTTHLSQKELLGIKNYLDFSEFLNNYQNYPVQGFIYLPINKIDKYFSNNPNVKVFHTNYLEQDINYFINKSVSCSSDYLNIVRKQYIATGRDNWREDADRYLENNIPTFIACLKSLIANSKDNFILMGNFDNHFNNNKNKVVLLAMSASQFLNALSWIEKFEKKYDLFIILIQYSRINISTCGYIFSLYKQLCADNDKIVILFKELPFSVGVSFGDWYFFEKSFDFTFKTIKQKNNHYPHN